MLNKQTCLNFFGHAPAQGIINTVNKFSREYEANFKKMLKLAEQGKTNTTEYKQLLKNEQYLFKREVKFRNHYGILAKDPCANRTCKTYRINKNGEPRGCQYYNATDHFCSYFKTYITKKERTTPTTKNVGEPRKEELCQTLAN